jgi:hypothetical protein
LADNGKIGIGTKEPQAKLDVVGSIKAASATIEGIISIPNASPATGLQENALVFGITHGLQPYPAPSRWGIERVYSNTQGYGLNFWKYDFGTVYGGGAGFRTMLFFNDSDNVGIGTDNPQAKLDVNGSFKARSASIAGKFSADTISVTKKLSIGTNSFLTNLQIGDTWTFQDASEGKNMGRNTYHNGANDVRIQSGVASRIAFNNSGDILLQATASGSAGQSISRWNTVIFANNGDVGIGTIDAPTAKLEVNGDFKAQSADIVGVITGNDLNVESAKVSGLLCAKEIRVSLSGSPCWPDYVFSKDYKLMPLKELERYISENKHIPNVPSAAEVETNGINVGEMNTILLQKVEELTLYILDLQKQIDELNK